MIDDDDAPGVCDSEVVVASFLETEDKNNNAKVKCSCVRKVADGMFCWHVRS